MAKPIGHDALHRVLSRAIGGATGLSRPSDKLIRIGAAGESPGFERHALRAPSPHTDGEALDLVESLMNSGQLVFAIGWIAIGISDKATNR